MGRRNGKSKKHLLQETGSLAQRASQRQTMEGVAMRWRAATGVLQGLLMLTFLISGISALQCHHYHYINHSTMQFYTPEEYIFNCSSAENVCTDAQLTFTIDKDVLTMGYKGCHSEDISGPKSIISGDRHFAIQFSETYCFHDLCNNHSIKWGVVKTPIKDKAEARGSNQCYEGFESSYHQTVYRTMTCSRGYNRCYNGTMGIDVGLSTSIMIRTCQPPACDGIKSQLFGPINITSKSGSCCSGINCNGKKIKIINPTNYGVRSTTNPFLSYDHYGPGFQGLSLQLCPLLAVLGTTILGIWG